MRRSFRLTTACLLLSLLPIVAQPTFADPPSIKTLNVNSKGNGTIKVGADEAKISSVLVNLKENGKADIQLVTIIIVFMKGTWAAGSDQNQIDLKITGGTVSGAGKGTGKILLKDDGKSLASMTLEGTTPTGQKYVVEFTAE